MFQIGNQNKAYDNHQKPGSYFTRRNNRPGMYLTWILPSAEISGNIFSDPDKKSDQQKGDI